MKKLLIFSTLLICLTASPKTFSAQKKYRLIQFYEDDNDNFTLNYAIAESPISEEQVKQSLHSNNKKNYSYLFYDKDNDFFDNTNTSFKSLPLLTKEDIQRPLKEYEIQTFHILRIKDVRKQKPNDKTTDNIEKITVTINDTVSSLNEALDILDKKGDDKLGTDNSDSEDIKPDKNINPSPPISPILQNTQNKISNLLLNDNELPNNNHNEKQDDITTNDLIQSSNSNSNSNSYRNEEKDNNKGTSSNGASSRIDSYRLEGLIILVGVLFFVVLNWSNLSKSSNSSKKESIDNAH